MRSTMVAGRVLIVLAVSPFSGCGNGETATTGPDADVAVDASPSCTVPPYTPSAGPPVSPTAPIAYGIKASPSNIAITPSTQPTSLPKVYVQPRNAMSHPETFWDDEDISALKSAISGNTNPTLVADFNVLKGLADKRITLTSSTATFDIFGKSHTLAGTTFTAQGVPIPQLVNGVPQYLGDPTGVSEANAGTIQLLGVVYTLTGDKSYGEFARQMLLSYASYYGQYAHPDGWTKVRYRSAVDGRLTYQFLNDAFILAGFAWGYDLIFNLSSFTDADHTNLRVNLFDAIAAEYMDPIEIVNGADYLSQGHNRSAISAAAVLLAGYACDDSTLVNNALYGTGGTVGNPKTGGGLTEVHWGSNILADGLWIESSLDYQTGIAACGVFDAAIIMEHHGMDVFGKYPLKRLLDAAVNIAYPDPPLLLPNLGNSSPTALLSSAAWQSNEVGVPYEYGYLYYQDPSYLPLIRNASQSLNLTVHAGAPSLFLDTPVGPGVLTADSFSGVAGTAMASDIFKWLLANGFFRESSGTQGEPIPVTPQMTTALMMKYPAQAQGILGVLQQALANVPDPAVQNVNYYVDGYGVLRLPSSAGAHQGINQLLVNYASNLKSHGQPEGMAIDLYALGGPLLALPGDVFPYNLPIDPAWYWTTLASNTLAVDQGSQIYGNGTFNPKTMQPPQTDQIVYGFSSTMGIQKVSSSTLYPGVTEDRAVFMTPSYVADIFAAFSTTTHIYDLPWHPVGTLETGLTLTPRSTTDLTNPGYVSLTNVLHAMTSDAWSATITMPNANTVPFWAAANPGTEIITADGHLYVYGNANEIQPPVVIERQSNVNNALFGTAIDISGGKYVTGIVQEGITSGELFGMLLRIAHGGALDYAFTSYSPGSFTSADGAFVTDGLQSFAVVNAKGLPGLYLGGGTTLSTPYGSLTRTDSAMPGSPGLAYVEQSADGSWVVGNLSPTDATILVSLTCAGIHQSVVVKANTTQKLQ
jgi:hypothetical protein